MHHFFVTPEQVRDGQIIISGTDVNHMKQVLRIKAGEEVQISDGDNHRYRCVLERYGKEGAILHIEEEATQGTELSSKLFLFQGLPKSDKMEWIVMKAVELGVYEIIPVETRRSVVRLDGKKAAKKTMRWQEIARGAAKQSGRGNIPRVTEVMDYKSALSYGKCLDVLLIPYELAEGIEETREVIAAILPGQSVGIFIGPEGGFEKEEAELALLAGAKEITLGRRILRTETAGIAVLSILMYHLEA